MGRLNSPDAEGNAGVISELPVGEVTYQESQFNIAEGAW
eukprot:gene37501-23935_t